MTRSFWFFVLFIVTFSIKAQQRERIQSRFGQPMPAELQMSSYDLDPEASAVVLFEQGKHSIKIVGNKIRVIKYYYKKIKVLDAQNFDAGEVKIKRYRDDEGSEVLVELEAHTINGLDKLRVSEDQVFSADAGKNWEEINFAFPKIENGSILEYRYRIQSPYFFDLGDWSFQGDFPRIYSEFISEIPANYKYRKSLIGSRDLDIDKSSVELDCFVVPGYGEPGDCNIAVYGMFDVPAFQKEDFMLSETNYASGLDYELMRYIAFDGREEDYSKEWKDVDREFKEDKGLGKQWNYAKYFKNGLPENILSIKDDLERAKAIYSFIQKHYTWDRSYSIFSKARVKEAFKEKRGSAAEINLALLNCFEAANLESYVVLLSTRDNGIVTKLYPILTEFNYAIAAIRIDDKIHLLDATDKLLPFGMLPLRTLNGDGRKFDFKNESTWLPITPFLKNQSSLAAELSINTEGELLGEVNETFTGYSALEKRKKHIDNSRKDYIQEKMDHYSDLEVSNFEVTGLTKIDENLSEKYEVGAPLEVIGNKLFVDVFFLKKFFYTNPFKLEKRNYPVDFGYPRTANYTCSIKVDPSFKVVVVPENKRIQLGKAANLSMYYEAKDNLIRVNFRLLINQSHFKADDYELLKSFFAEIINVQNNSKFVLEKI